MAGFRSCRRDVGDEGVVESLQDREDLGEIGWSGRDDGGRGDLTFPNSESELDRDRVNRNEFRGRGGPLVHRQGIVAEVRTKRMSSP